MTPRDTRDEARYWCVTCDVGVATMEGTLTHTGNWHSVIGLPPNLRGLLRAPETPPVIEQLEACITELKSRLYERGLCINGAPHYCPNCDNTFTAPEAQDGPSYDFPLAENARLKAALKARETQERGWQEREANARRLYEIQGRWENEVLISPEDVEWLIQWASPPAQTEDSQ